MTNKKQPGQADKKDASPALGFDREKLIDILTDRISNHFNDDDHGIERSLTIGIHGEWGSGKSTVLDALARHDIFNKSENKITLPVRFNTWRYEKEAHLIIPLLKTAQLAIKTYMFSPDVKEKGKFKQKLLKSANTLGQVAISLAAGVKFGIGIPGIAKLEFDVDKALKKARAESESDQDEEHVADFDSLYFDVNTQLANITGRNKDNKDNKDTFRLNLLFLIDDLDRCLPEKAVEVMESIKLFLDVEGCAFVLALDEEIVERGILHRYRDYVFNSEKEDQNKGLSPKLPITGAEYLEKIIQLPVKLPQPTEDQMREFLQKRFGEELFQTQEQNNDLQQHSVDVPTGINKLPKTKEQSLLDLFIKAIPLVPRKHVRAAELLILTRKMLEGRFQYDLIRLAQFILLQLFAPELFRWGRHHPSFMTTIRDWSKVKDDKDDHLWLTMVFLVNKTNTIIEERDKAVKKSEGYIVLILEEDLRIVELVTQTCDNRNGFDPRRLLTEADKQESDAINFKPYYNLSGQMHDEIGSKAGVEKRESAHVEDEQRFFANLSSNRVDVWARAFEDFNEDQTIPDGLIPKIIEIANKHRDKDYFDDWLEKVFPYLSQEGQNQLSKTLISEIIKIAGNKQKEDYFDIRLTGVFPYLSQENQKQLSADLKDKRKEVKATVESKEKLEPETRARAGRILGWLGDDRDGVGLNRKRLPDIAWEMISPPEGLAYRRHEDEMKDELVLVAEGGKLVLPEKFYLARYPVTWQQFQVFVEAKDGYYNTECWQGLDVDKVVRKLADASWPIPNHPRETVYWHQAMAFCRWLNANQEDLINEEMKQTGTDWEIRLPTGWEWQFAALGEKEDWCYPWGKDYVLGKANVNETYDSKDKHYLQRTTAVGLYLPGEAHGEQTRLHDQCGNVWEWCLYDVNKLKIKLGGDDAALCAMHGGSWGDGRGFRSSRCRMWWPADIHNFCIGFRVCCVPAINGTPNSE